MGSILLYSLDVVVFLSTNLPIGFIVKKFYLTIGYRFYRSTFSPSISHLGEYKKLIVVFGEIRIK